MENNIIGTWKLISFELKTDNIISYPFGENPLGFLIYNENGYMEVMISKKDRKPLSSEDITSIAEDEKSQLADGFIGYSGKYEILDEKIVHYVEMSFIPNWIGRPLERFYKFHKGNLILKTTSEEINGAEFISCITWGKINPCDMKNM
jgi:hypothetical protein